MCVLVVTALVGRGLAAAVTMTSTAPDRWQHVPSVVIGTVVLQLPVIAAQRVFGGGLTAYEVVR